MECPNCRQLGDFPVHALHHMDVRDPAHPPAGVQVIERSDKSLILAAGTSTCRLCWSPVMLILEGRYEVFSDIMKTVHQKGFELPHAIRRNNESLRLVRSYPPVPTDGTDPSYPKEVNEALKDIHSGHKGGISPRMIIAMCRSVLDTATKALLTESEAKKKLIARIDLLADKAVITGALKDYAHRVRIGGNAALHDAEGTREEAEDLETFVRQFLDLVYGLPARIDRRKLLDHFEDETQGGRH